jgi:hypothetical protein
MNTMKPGERIRLIETATELLLAKPQANRLLTLRQFGFSTHYVGDWDDDAQYVMDMIADGSDDQLGELATFLRGEEAEPAHRDDDQPWGDLPVRAFISHIHEQRWVVGDLKKALAFYHVDAFVAHDDIDVSKRWREVIKAGLATCDMFVAFLHDGYHASQWCDQEAGWALGRNVPIISARPHDVVRRDGFLEEHQDFVIPANSQGSPAWHIAQQVFLTAVNDSRTREAGLDALVETFVTSWSFDTTRFLWHLLDRVQKFEPAHLRRLEYAVATNDQVYAAVLDAKAIPDLVKALIEKFEPPMLNNDPWATPVANANDPWATPANTSEPPF